MPDNHLKDLFETSDEELSNFLKVHRWLGIIVGRVDGVAERTMEAKNPNGGKGLNGARLFLLLSPLLPRFSVCLER